jgi:hypothetical protein
LVKDQSKKVLNDDGSFKVTLIFDDTLSWVPGGNVSANWDVITKFDWRLATFTTNTESVDVEVKDNYGNVLNQTINLADL